MATELDKRGSLLPTQTDQILQCAESLDAAVIDLLPLIANAYSWEWAVYWKVDIKSGVLRAFSIWKAPCFVGVELEEDTRKRVYSSGEDIPGRVWQLGKPSWSDDPVMHMSLPRSLKASAAGFRMGAWFPIVSQQCTFGIFEFLGKRVEPKNESALGTLDQLGHLIGSWAEARNLSQTTGGSTC